ncbi:metallophosphoesterase [bacterium]|nr:metallophosphoesterase [bacterium]
MPNTKPIRFAHLTDLHFTTLRQNRYPTGVPVLEATVADLNAQEVDFVVLTGDLFHYPDRVPEEIDAMRAILERLNMPFYAAFGNHDVEGDEVHARKELIMRRLGDHGLSGMRPHYALSPAEGVKLVALDSTDNGSDRYLTWRGHFSRHQAAWLHETLTASRDELAILAIHHPPITPYPLMGALKFEERDRLRLQAAIAPHAHAPLMLCGHYHLSSSTPFASTTVLTGPSLVEHPHQYRIFTVQHHAHAHEIRYEWRKVPLPMHDDRACARGTAMRHLALNRLSYARRGTVTVPRVGALTP